MPQTGGAINKPPKPKPSPAPKSPPKPVRRQGDVKPDINTTGTGTSANTNPRPAPTSESKAKGGAGGGAKSDLGTSAVDQGGTGKGGAISKPSPKKVGGKTATGGGGGGSTVTTPSYKRRGTIRRGGSTFAGISPGIVRSGGTGGGYQDGERHDNVDIKPPTQSDSPRVGGGFPEIVGTGYRGAPAYFDAEGGGVGGGGQVGGATNPLASSVASAFSQSSLEEVLHGNKKKGRAKRSRRTE